MNNTRFATIVHILTLLAKFPDQWLSSDWIAESISINPAMVRKELAVLHQLGWVISKKGKEGGTKLHVLSSEISMAAIYNAVKNTNILGKKNKCADTQCLVGKQINIKLDELFQETDQTVIQALQKQKLTDFVSQFD